MNTSTILAFLLVLGAGIAIGGQGTITNLTGQRVGPLYTGFLFHVGGAIVGGVIVLVMLLNGESAPRIGGDGASPLYILAAGVFGMIVLPSIAFAFPRIGQVAGQGAIILGQMLVAVVVDSRGLGGGERIPLEPRRLAGLLVMGVAAWLLVPRQ